MKKVLLILSAILAFAFNSSGQDSLSYNSNLTLKKNRLYRIWINNEITGFLVSINDSAVQVSRSISRSRNKFGKKSTAPFIHYSEIEHLSIVNKTQRDIGAAIGAGIGGGIGMLIAAKTEEEPTSPWEGLANLDNYVGRMLLLTGLGMLAGGGVGAAVANNKAEFVIAKNRENFKQMHESLLRIADKETQKK